MKGRSWALALFIPAIAGINFLAFAKENIGTPGEPPKIEKGIKEKADSKNPPAQSSPILVRVVESPSDAAHNAERENKTNSHDDKDLKAQELAAKSTYEQIIPAWIQAWAALFGGILLVWTLWETRKTAKSAENAAITAARALDSVERPKIIMLTGNCTINEPFAGVRELIIFFSLQNIGKQPAIIDDLRCGIVFTENAPHLNDAIRQFEEVHTILNNGDDLKHATWNPALIQGDIGWFYGIVRYSDFFDIRHESEWCWKLDGMGLPINQFTHPERNRRT